MSLNNSPALVHARSISPEWCRLHALHVHGIVAADFRVVREFDSLADRGFAKPELPRPYKGLMYYRITPRGREMAFNLF